MFKLSESEDTCILMSSESLVTSDILSLSENLSSSKRLMNVRNLGFDSEQV